MNAKTLMTTALAGLLATAAHAITSEEIAAALDVDPSVGTFSAGTNLMWRIDTDNKHKGVSSMRSPAISHSQFSELLTLRIRVDKPSLIEFWYMTSTEGGCDPLIATCNDVEFFHNGGNIGWSLYHCVADKIGEYIFTFQYGKDGSVNRNLDSVFVDDLSITPLSPESTNVRVSEIKCTQRTPWNGKVDIDYTVTCEKEGTDIWVYPVGYDKDADTVMAPRAIEGEGVNAPVKAGKHRMTWTVTDDYPNFNSTAFTMKMTALVGAAPYMVVDLSGGVDALSYPITYLSSVPEGGWSEEYKTTKLVLRLIPAGNFQMGSPSDEGGRGSNEGRHTVVLTKPFYIGVFECTQKQYQLVMGSNPSSNKGDARPVECVSYQNLRGAVNGIGWPTHNQVDADSFMGRLRSKVNMLFDLPTEAEWEYSCRAGSSAALNNGKSYSENSLKEVARCYYNNGYDYTVDGKGGYSRTTSVGCYKDNAWGLFDMHGNVHELCCDYGYDNLSAYSSIDPKGVASSGACRVRGGAWRDTTGCRSAYRGTWSMTDRSEYGGFRVYCSPVAQ